MGRRSGDLDPAVPLHVQRIAGLSAEAVDDALNRAAGLFGLCGTSDVREVLSRVSAGDAAAQLALDVYVHRIRKYVGAYVAVLGRADALLFTGGVGENAATVRAGVCRDLEVLGIELDAARNAAASGECTDVATARSRVRILVVATDEERQIAREALAVLRS
jgi:acetate kinase